MLWHLGDWAAKKAEGKEQRPFPLRRENRLRNAPPMLDGLVGGLLLINDTLLNWWHILRYSYSIMILDHFEGRSVHQDMHVAVVNGEYQILQLRVILNWLNDESKLRTLFHIEMPLMGFVSGIIR